MPRKTTAEIKTISDAFKKKKKLNFLRLACWIVQQISLVKIIIIRVIDCVSMYNS